MPGALFSPGPSVSQLSGALLWQQRNRVLLEQKRETNNKKPALSLSDRRQEQLAGPEKSPVLSLCPSPPPSSARGGGHDTAPAWTPQHHRHPPGSAAMAVIVERGWPPVWGIMRDSGCEGPCRGTCHLQGTWGGGQLASALLTGWAESTGQGDAPGCHVASLFGPRFPQLSSSLWSRHQL